jgi:hypothetical protein
VAILPRSIAVVKLPPPPPTTTGDNSHKYLINLTLLLAYGLRCSPVATGL